MCKCKKKCKCKKPCRCDNGRTNVNNVVPVVIKYYEVPQYEEVIEYDFYPPVVYVKWVPIYGRR